MNDWNASGVITITTDFGHKGPFSAVMQGVILQRYAQARIIDLAHDIPAHWPAEAGFWLSRCYTYFPPGTVHIAIVDPGVGTDRDILLVMKDRHLFMAPDNGLLAPLLDEADKILKLQASALAASGIAAPSPTFHGRDVFAPLAAELAAGTISPEDIATVTTEWTPGWLEDPVVGDTRVSGMIVTVDAFGNLISNIDAQSIAQLTQPTVAIAGHEIQMQRTYGNVLPGEYLALINSFGVVEVARSEKSAADGLSAERGAPVIVSSNLSPA